MYLIARLELSYDGVQVFMETAPRIRALMEERGCKLVLAMLQGTGRLNTAIHVWKLEDANAYFEAVNYIRSHPEFDDIVANLAKAVVNEELTLAVDAPYAPT